MKRIFFIVLLMIIINSCISESDQKGINAVLELSKAENIIIGSGVNISSDHKPIKYKLLTIKYGKKQDTQDLNYKNSASILALTFYKNSLVQNVGDINALKIRIDGDLNGSPFSFAKLYLLDSLRIVNSVFEDTKSLGDLFKDANYSKFYKLFLKGVPLNVNNMKFQKRLVEFDKKYGRTKSLSLVGFDFGTATLPDKSVIPSIILYLKFHCDTSFQRIKVDYATVGGINEILWFKI